MQFFTSMHSVSTGGSTIITPWAIVPVKAACCRTIPVQAWNISMKALGIALIERFGYRVTRLDSRIEIDSA